jgi:hypothetical protein
MAFEQLMAEAAVKKDKKEAKKARKEDRKEEGKKEKPGVTRARTTLHSRRSSCSGFGGGKLTAW